MDDKEVGKLLRKRLAVLESLYTDRQGVSAFKMDIVIGLICKLVEEATLRNQAIIEGLTHESPNLDELRPQVLKRFGITSWLD